jgi:hypothetical protein
MSNMWGRSGAPMIQPTKDEIRGWLSETRSELKAAGPASSGGIQTKRCDSKAGRIGT